MNVDTQKDLEQHEASVISFDSIKLNHFTTKNLSSYLNYLKLLSSDEILTETKFLMDDINQSHCDLITMKKAQVLIKEISSRVQFDSPESENLMNQMCQSIANLINQYHQVYID